jgi:hypothetical protein
MQDGLFIDGRVKEGLPGEEKREIPARGYRNEKGCLCEPEASLMQHFLLIQQ